MLTIKQTQEFGRGVYASGYLNPEIIIGQYELLVLSETDTRLVNEYTQLTSYTFRYNDTQDCLVMGYGELFNHSDTPNVKFELIDFDGRKVMKYTTLRRITAGEQLCIDYNSDVAINLNNYKVNLI